MGKHVLVTGATGYIGGRLVPTLLEAGHTVRCLARTPSKLRDRPWADDVEVVRGDVLRPETLDDAMEGIDALYYLVHSMDGEGEFEDRDRTAAANVRDAAAAAGVDQIVYLGGLGIEDDELSPHLSSRHEVGRTLADGPIPVTELRAAIIIGSGSASFEMLRNLVEVLPAMITPRWVETRGQPIAIRDVLFYLCASIEEPAAKGRILEVGGPDVLSYREMMQLYAEVAGLRKRLIIGVPFLTPQLSSHWVGLVTPLPTGLAKPLVASLVNDVVVTDDSVKEILPHDCLPMRTAFELALRRIKDLQVDTRWSGAGGAFRWGIDDEFRAEAKLETLDREDPSRTAEPEDHDPDWAGGKVLADERTVETTASPDAVFDVVSSLGGDRGWMSADWMWEIRGLLDTAVGGVGLRRGRRHPTDLQPGESLDFWRVEVVDRPHLLRLHAEMKLPGEAWLEFRIEPLAQGSRLTQRARFHPRGLWGRAYWAVLVPFHQFLFPRMARRIVEAAEQARETAPVDRADAA